MRGWGGGGSSVKTADSAVREGDIIRSQLTADVVQMLVNGNWTQRSLQHSSSEGWSNMLTPPSNKLTPDR